MKAAEQAMAMASMFGFIMARCDDITNSSDNYEDKNKKTNIKRKRKNSMVRKSRRKNRK